MNLLLVCFCLFLLACSESPESKVDSAMLGFATTVPIESISIERESFQGVADPALHIKVPEQYLDRKLVDINDNNEDVFVSSLKFPYYFEYELCAQEGACLVGIEEDTVFSLPLASRAFSAKVRVCESVRGQIDVCGVWKKGFREFAERIGEHGLSSVFKMQHSLGQKMKLEVKKVYNILPVILEGSNNCSGANSEELEALTLLSELELREYFANQELFNVDFSESLSLVEVKEVEEEGGDDGLEVSDYGKISTIAFASVLAIFSTATTIKSLRSWSQRVKGGNKFLFDGIGEAKLIKSKFNGQYVPKNYSNLTLDELRDKKMLFVRDPITREIILGEDGKPKFIDLSAQGLKYEKGGLYQVADGKQVYLNRVDGDYKTPVFEDGKLSVQSVDSVKGFESRYKWSSRLSSLGAKGLFFAQAVLAVMLVLGSFDEDEAESVKVSLMGYLGFSLLYSGVKLYEAYDKVRSWGEYLREKRRVDVDGKEVNLVRYRGDNEKYKDQLVPKEYSRAFEIEYKDLYMDDPFSKDLIRDSDGKPLNISLHENGLKLKGRKFISAVDGREVALNRDVVSEGGQQKVSFIVAKQEKFEVEGKTVVKNRLNILSDPGDRKITLSKHEGDPYKKGGITHSKNKRRFINTYAGGKYVGKVAGFGVLMAGLLGATVTLGLGGGEGECREFRDKIINLKGAYDRLELLRLEMLKNTALILHSSDY